MSIGLIDSLATTEPLADVFSDGAVLTAMLRFEVGLARAEARAGIIPQSSAESIAAAGRSEPFDPAAISRSARSSGTIAIPFVEMLTARVRAIDAAGANHVHWGATSQDLTDSALVLCLARARPVLAGDHERLTRALRRLSDEHAGTVMLGRTLLQPAPPVTFGLKVAGWYGACARGWARLASAFDETLVLQFGGASGTLAALGERGLDVSIELARELELSAADAPWHGHRDRLAAFVAACGVYTGTLGKIARDVSLLMQSEVGEAAEPGGGSSTMPHKRNPAGCAIALAAATRAPGMVASFLSGMSQEHERGLGGGHAELPTVASLVQATAAALAAVRDVAETLQVDPERMRANIAATGGAVFAERAMLLLAPALGREVAHTLIGKAVASRDPGGGTLAALLGAIPDVAKALTPAELSDLDRPEAYLGVAERLRLQLLATR